MKYIRTKDSVQELGIDKELKKEGVRNYYFYEWKGIHMLMDKNDVKKYKQADTIEELCDEFVLHYSDTMKASIPIPWATYERRNDNWQKQKEKLIDELNNKQRKAIVYGAIWTDKGLVYVAKMNEKGELDLL